MMKQKSTSPNFPGSNTEGATHQNFINRRKFIGGITTATLAMTVVPRHLIGGSGFVAPSDKIALAYIGTGTQGLR